MNTSRVLVVGCCLVGVLTSVGFSAEIALVPVGATGSHTVNGNEIILEGGGQWVFLEVYLSGWDPAELRAFQAVIDSSGYTTGLTGTLTPATLSCSVDSECEAAFGTGALCDVPPGDGITCTPGFIDSGRSDYVFADTPEIPAVDLSTLNYRYASTVLMTPVPDPGSPQYAGTLVLDVAPGTFGTFTVGFQSGLMQDENNQLITPITFTAALITVNCGVDEDCDDGNACTDNTCEEDGSCSYSNNYNDQVDCCNPVDGTLTPIDDGNACTADECDPDTGDVTHTELEDGAPCDDGLFCNDGETCMDGVCSGGGPHDCADDVDCTDDSCDESGDRCVNAPNHDYCPDDGLFCNGPEICDPDIGCDHGDPPCAGDCDEEFDKCLCEPPFTVTIGQRYLKIAPMPPDSGPQAIVVTPNCPGAAPRYVGDPTPTIVDGEQVNLAQLVDKGHEAWLTSAEWGELYVCGDEIVPETDYMVQEDCGTPLVPALSIATNVTMPQWGDTVGPFIMGEWTPPDGWTSIIDVLAVLEKFKGLDRAPSTWRVDLVEIGQQKLRCSVDQRIDIVDVLGALNGFMGISFSQMTGCPVPCP